MGIPEVFREEAARSQRGGDLVRLDEACKSAGIPLEMGEEIVRRRWVHRVRVYSGGFILVDVVDLTRAARESNLQVNKGFSNGVKTVEVLSAAH